MVNDDASVEEALMWFQKTLGLDPSIAPAQCGAVNILNLLGRFDEATEAANGALGVIGEGTADHISLREERAFALLKLGRAGEAMADVEHALANGAGKVLNTNLHSAVYDRVASDKMEDGDFSDALDMFDKSSSKNAGYNKALCLMNLERHDEACEMLTKVRRGRARVRVCVGVWVCVSAVLLFRGRRPCWICFFPLTSPHPPPLPLHRPLLWLHTCSLIAPRCMYRVASYCPHVRFLFLLLLLLLPPPPPSSTSHLTASVLTRIPRYGRGGTLLAHAT
jgi:hypothetical protein